MELEHSFTVPVPKSRAWDVLLDVEKVAPCMPGATLDSVDGDEIHGRIKVKVGPISMTYAGTAKFVERDEEAGVVTLEASGKETKGAGTASASVRSELVDLGNETQVSVKTTLNVTGKPAQFGRGVMNEVGGKLIGIFATNLAAMLAEPETAAAENEAAENEAAEPDVLLDVSIDELKLAARATASLHREGIGTLGQLAAKTDDELLAIDGIGPASVVEIKAGLVERGLTPGQARVGMAEAAAQAEIAGVSAAGTSATSAPVADGKATSTSATGHPATAREAAHQLEDDAINLLKVAGMPVLKRAIPVLVGLTAALLIGLRQRLRRRKR